MYDTYIFGTSAYQCLKLLELKNRNIIYYKFKAKTARCFRKSTCEHLIEIKKILKNKKPKCVIFSFGCVDLAFVYFYKLFHTKTFSEFDEKKFFDDTLSGYIDFVKSINAENKYIIIPYHSPIEDKHLLSSLKVYNIINDDDINKHANEDINKYISRKNRNHIYDTFIKEAKKRIGSSNIKIIDINPLITHKNGTVKKKYLDESKFNVHLRWLPLLKVLTKKINSHGIHEKYIDTKEINKIEKEYETKKHEQQKKFIKEKK